MIQAYFKGKLVIQDNCIKQDEDFKTSSSIGLLQYLPDDVFWNIMRNCCVGFTTTDFGKIESFNFWAHNDPTGTRNTNYVEPDVWIETEKYDVIIEVKKKDENGEYSQSIEQWEDQVQSVKNEQNNNDYEKPIILIALGGNDVMQPENALNSPVYKASWYNLMNAVVKERDAQSDNGYIFRILDDVVELFARQGVMKIEWLNTLPLVSVDAHALDLWKTIKSKPSVGFSSIPQMIINETNIQQWRPIN